MTDTSTTHGAGYPSNFDIELRREAYIFALEIYDSFESVLERGVLAGDIEKSANVLLKQIAAYSAKENKGQVLRDITAETKGIKALLGVARDTKLITRESTLALIEKVSSLEMSFVVIENKAVESREDESAEAAQSGTDLFQASPQLPEIQQINGVISSVRGMSEDILKFEGENVEITPSQSDLLDQKIDVKDVITSATTPHAGSTVLNSETQNRQSISKRHEAILEVLKRRNEVSVGELARLFTGVVGPKTLQRDLQDLAERGVVNKKGEKRWTVYSLAVKA